MLEVDSETHISEESILIVILFLVRREKETLKIESSGTPFSKMCYVNGRALKNTWNKYLGTLRKRFRRNPFTKSGNYSLDVKYRNAGVIQHQIKQFAKITWLRHFNISWKVNDLVFHNLDITWTMKIGNSTGRVIISCLITSGLVILALMHKLDLYIKYLLGSYWRERIKFIVEY